MAQWNLIINSVEIPTVHVPNLNDNAEKEKKSTQDLNIF